MSETLKPATPYDAIIWSDHLAIGDQALLEENRRVVQLLCDVAQVTKWLTNDRYPNIPDIYDVQGVEIQFLPHWDFYSVGGINLNLPTSAQDIQRDVRAVQYLMTRGHKPQQP